MGRECPQVTRQGPIIVTSAAVLQDYLLKFMRPVDVRNTANDPVVCCSGQLLAYYDIWRVVLNVSSFGGRSHLKQAGPVCGRGVIIVFCLSG